MTGAAGRGPSGPLATWPGAVIAGLDIVSRIIAVGCLAFMFGALLLNVVLRYGFGSGIAWAYEIHALLLPWLVGAGMVIAAAGLRHIEVNLLADLLPARVQLPVALLVQGLVVVICVSVLWTGQPILRAAQFQRLSTLGITQVWGYASLVWAFGGMAVVAALHALRLLTGQARLATDPGRSSLS